MNCQRWRERRDSYRPAVGDAPINTSLYEVSLIPDDATAKAFVLEHHYSGTYPAARWRVGLHRHGDLVGVAVLSHPCSNKVLTSVFPGDPLESVELGRFVLLDDVPANGESWFLARCFELLRDKVRGIVSFSDPVARLAGDGLVVFPGHIGTIYQATNAHYLGRATPRTLRLLPDATVLSARAIQKLLAGERGWRYTAAMLERHGADPLTGDRRAWAATWIDQLTTKLRHPGNHRYAWGLDRATRKHMAPTAPYPKWKEAA